MVQVVAEPGSSRHAGSEKAIAKAETTAVETTPPKPVQSQPIETRPLVLFK